MKDKLVTFETAKSTKEKDFNIFNVPNGIDNDNYRYYHSNGEIGIGNIQFINDCELKKECFELYPAPTQSLLQRWLREKCDIHVCSISQYNTNRQFQYYYATVNGKTIDELEFDTYEQALEKGLQEGLKLITSKT